MSEAAELPEHKLVLVVEDDDAIRETLSTALSEEGFDVQSSANGAEAMLWILECIRDGKRLPSVVVLDVWMPRMNGLEFFQKFRSLADCKDVPVLVVSAGENLEHTAWFADVSGLPPPERLPKPFDLQTACTRVRELAR
jgi:DNA-binding response OmpR family regulator